MIGKAPVTRCGEAIDFIDSAGVDVRRGVGPDSALCLDVGSNYSFADMKHLVTVLDWYGPYNYDEALDAAKKHFSDGVYLCIGKVKSEHGKPKIQYVGIAGKELKTRVGDNHPKLKLVTRNRQFWFGEIGSLGPPGKKAKKTNASLDFAEWALVYFLQPKQNVKKTKNPPNRPVTVLNRWWRKKDFETPLIKRPHPDWPDLIDYLGPSVKAKVVWFRSPKRVDVS